MKGTISSEFDDSPSIRQNRASGRFLSDLKIRSVTAARGGFQTVSNVYTLLLEYIIRGLCTQNIYHGLRSISQAGEMFSKSAQSRQAVLWVVAIQIIRLLNKYDFIYTVGETHIIFGRSSAVPRANEHARDVPGMTLCAATTPIQHDLPDLACG